ncbi:MAG: hypothetical protein P0S95_01865 [Rhabdochlamydiaceae bacterium]|nr:hypothetical protein [Candidatus Amphrikana amoebophyrae]
MKHILFAAMAALPFTLFAMDEIDIPKRHTLDLKKGGQGDKLSVRRVSIMSNIGFDYADEPIVIMTGFSGKAYYCYQVNKGKTKERTYYNMGGGYASTEADIKEFEDMNNTNASAVVGISFERDLGTHFMRSWGFGLSQPIYDTKGNFAPEVSVNCALKY